VRVITAFSKLLLVVCLLVYLGWNYGWMLPTGLALLEYAYIYMVWGDFWVKFFTGKKKSD
jgi:hypothetical protein